MTDQLDEVERLRAACAELLRFVNDYHGVISLHSPLAAEVRTAIEAAAQALVRTSVPQPAVRVNTELLAAAKDYVSKTDDPVTYHYKPRYDPRCGCGDCGVRTHERLLDAIANVENQEKK